MIKTAHPGPTEHRNAQRGKAALDKNEVPIEQTHVDPVESAREAGLRYVTDRVPGITRRKSGRGFSYRKPDGSALRDKADLARIKSLAIPPAWTDVWISPYANGHIQATGYDDAGRKQYRYHPKWREARDETKYGRMIAFGKALPQIRKRVSADLEKQGLSREKVLATVVRLLETTLIRVGNDEYAKTHRHYGLTTMLNRHVEIHGSKLTFKFRGKSGVKHNIDVEDRRLARVVKRTHDLPGQRLFEYVDDNGERKTVDSSDVNEYLQAITGLDFTAKDFRTWSGTVLAAMALQEFEAFSSNTQAKRNIVRAIETVSQRLGNTPAICRKCYVHPAVLESYMDKSLVEVLRQKTQAEIDDNLSELKPEEAAVLVLLQKRLAEESAGGAHAA